MWFKKECEVKRVEIFYVDGIDEDEVRVCYGFSAASIDFHVYAYDEKILTIYFNARSMKLRMHLNDYIGFKQWYERSVALLS